MPHSLREHQLSAAERAWLTEASAQQFQPRIAKVKLKDTLPSDFDPSRIDRALYSGARITLAGRWLLNTGDPILHAVALVIDKIRRSIIDNPGVDNFTAQGLAASIPLSAETIGRALFELGQIGGFMSSGTGAGVAESLSSITLTGDSSYDEYLRYIDLESLLQRYYVATRPIPVEPKQLSIDRGNWLPDALAPDAMPTTSITSIRPNTAFVLMPMDPKNHQLEDIYNAIKQTCSAFDIRAFRADEIEHQSRITDVVLAAIRECEFLIADLSFQRPNVYYEVGYAHALNKRPILYRQARTKLHFDLSVHNAPEYRNVTELVDLLSRRLEAMLGRSAWSKFANSS